jgi:hypothetical protein
LKCLRRLGIALAYASYKLGSDFVGTLAGPSKPEITIPQERHHCNRNFQKLLVRQIDNPRFRVSGHRTNNVHIQRT